MQTVKSFIEHKLSKRVSMFKSTDGSVPFTAFVDEGVELHILVFDAGTLRFTFLDASGRNCQYVVNSIIFDSDLIDGYLPINNARNGALVINNQCITELDEFLLRNFNKKMML
jgi:hypothetical protein